MIAYMNQVFIRIRKTEVIAVREQVIFMESMVKHPDRPLRLDKGQGSKKNEVTQQGNEFRGRFKNVEICPQERRKTDSNRDYKNSKLRVQDLVYLSNMTQSVRRVRAVGVGS